MPPKDNSVTGRIGQFFHFAENYRFSEIRSFTSVHPEAPHSINEHTILVGSAGAGKSMAMRQLCSQTQDSDRVFPIYLHAEQWLARSAGEAVGMAGAIKPTASGALIESVAGAMLSAGVIHRITRILGVETAFRMVEGLPGRLPTAPSDVNRWLTEEVYSLNLQLRSGNLANGPGGFQLDLRSFLEHVGETLEGITGKRLLLLIDQLDRVSPIYFDLLRPALGRTTAYVLLIATRPSPCAPEPTVLSLPTNSYELLWLGTRFTGHKWEGFLLEIASQLFDTKVCAVLGTKMPYLSSLAGPSIRHFLRIAREVSRGVDNGDLPRIALHSACQWMKSRFESELESALTGFPDAGKFLRQLQTAVNSSPDVERPQIPQRLILQPTDDKLMLEDETLAQLRVAVREGLFLPSDPARYGLDHPNAEYRLLPMSAVRSASPGAGIHIEDRAHIVSESTFTSWTATSRKKGKAIDKPRPYIFYSHWMNSSNGHVRTFLPDFRQLVAAFADVKTGESGRSAQLAQFIVKAIADSTIVAVQLDPFRSTIGLEIGWAIGNGKPVLLGVHDPSSLALLPEWITAFEIQGNDSSEERAAFAKASANLIDAVAAGDETAQWKIDETGKPLTQLRRSLSTAVVVGSGPKLLPATTRLNDQLLSEGHSPAVVIDTSDTGVGALLTKAVRESYTGTSLMAVMSGDRHADLLALVSMGAHTFREKDERVPINRRTKTIPRRAFLLAADNPAHDSIPTILRGLPGSLMKSDVDEIADATFRDFVTISHGLGAR